MLWQILFNERNAQALASHLWHIREIRILAYSMQSGQEQYTWLTSPAPILDTLNLRMDRSDPPHDRTVLPPILFGGHAPRLRHIHLGGFSNFTWTSPMLDNLVSLVLTDAERAPLDEVLAALERMRATLQHLEFGGSVPQSSDVSRRSLLDLPALTTLRLEDDAVSCIALLSRLRLPSTVRLHFECTADGRGNDFHALFLALATHLGRDVTAPTPLDISFTAHDTLLEVEVTRHPRDYDTAVDLKLSLHWPQDSSAAFDFMQASWRLFSPCRLASVGWNFSA
ncbi:hypothetical protein BV25DRAFT_1828626 [Artomyces pyxidatus]|uniref:Uncharacterized protein n=1 Tax=Artomyces pyxidatus TaxID=48021 RepID=A0ACB8SUM0_9AGAM|nr:hypothetical protein BV25DRAFT_1828626 [Artomyces pyxidatus]